MLHHMLRAAAQRAFQTLDPYFKYVTMLLHGDGTNGAQNNTFLDSSTNNFTITRNGNTTQGTFSPYGSNWSNYFDGSSYLVTSSTQIVPTGSFTVECWVYVTSTANQAFVAQGTSGNSARFSICIDGGLWWTQIGNTSINVGTPALNTWNYLAATFNGSTLTLYVNGTSVGTASTTTSAQNNTLAIGTLGAGWATSGYYVTGYISNVRVSNTVRTISTPTTPYTFDANTRLLTCADNRFIDDSTNAFAITTSGTPSVQRFSPFSPTSAYSTSVIGGSGYFDGNGDFLTLTGSTATNFSGVDWTIETWVYSNGAPPADYTYIIQSQSGANNWLPYLGIALMVNGTINCAINAVNYTSTQTISFNTWNHLALVRSSGVVKLYINGVASSVSVTSDVVNSNLSFWFGKVDNTQGGGSYIYYLNGYMSSVRFVKGTAVYTSAFTPPTAPLTAITNTSLLLNYTNAGILDNAMMNDLETVGNAQISTSVKKYGTGSMYFDGTGDYLLAAPSENYQLGTGDFTIEFWINASASGSYNQVVGTYNVNHDSGAWRVGNRFNSLNQVYFARGTGSGVNEFTASVNVNDGSWHHVAVVRSSGTVTIYVDGTSSASASITGTCSSTNQLRVGYNPRDTAYVTGYIDDLRITKGVARYTANFTPPTAAFPNN